MSAAFSPDTPARDGQPGFDRETLEPRDAAGFIASIPAHTGAVWNVSFTPEGDALVTSDRTGRRSFGTSIPVK